MRLVCLLACFLTLQLAIKKFWFSLKWLRQCFYVSNEDIADSLDVVPPKTRSRSHNSRPDDNLHSSEFGGRFYYKMLSRFLTKFSECCQECLPEFILTRPYQDLP